MNTAWSTLGAGLVNSEGGRRRLHGVGSVSANPILQSFRHIAANPRAPPGPIATHTAARAISIKLTYIKRLILIKLTYC